MKNFDFYEFTGILSPGVLLLFSISLIYPKIGLILQGKDFSVGDLGLFVILSYIAGHLLGAVGNLFETIWWKLWGGMPTDWIRSGKHDLFSRMQIESIQKQLQNKLALDKVVEFSALSQKEWMSLTRQVYAAVAAAKLTQRIDIFNGNYGFFRGLTSAFFSIFILFVIEYGFSNWKVCLLIIAGAIIATFRMHRFGKYYARELFVQFLQISTSEKDALKK